AGAVALLSVRPLDGAAPAQRPAGRAFSVGQALLFAVLLSSATAAVSFATTHFGRGAADLGAALAGFVDVHAAPPSIFAPAAGRTPGPADGLRPLLLGFTSNTVSKLVAASAAGGRRYGLRVAAGLLVLAAAMWSPWVAGQLGDDPAQASREHATGEK